DAWADLAATGPTAYTAVCSLAAHSGEAVRLLGERLRPVAVDAKRVRAWVADLDAEAFDQRQAAEKQLAALQEHVEGDLRESLAGASPEARSRLVRLLQRIEDGPERWRRSRSLEVLERAGSPEAVKLLRALAAGHPGSTFTREARESLARLAR